MTNIEINEKQTTRLAIFANQREVTFADAIRILLDEAEANQPNKNSSQDNDYIQHALEDAGVIATPSIRIPYSHRLEILYFSAESNKVSETNFKHELLITEQAQVFMFYHDGRTEEKIWLARNMSDSSSVKGNLLSGYLRGWRAKGIRKAELHIVSNSITDAIISQ